MSIDKQRTAVADLAVGMYVSALDRPWLETPFLFQGFLIESDDTVEELREHCEYVFIDSARGDSSIVISRQQYEAIHVQPSRPESNNRKVVNVNNTNEIDDTRKLKVELPEARVAHVQVETAVHNLYEKIKHGTAVDAETVQASIDPMIDSIARNNDAMSWLARMKKKDDYVYDHSVSSAVWSIIFGKHLGLDRNDLKVLGTGAIFMDVGKTRIPYELLTKATELSADETRLMRDHVKFGLEIAQDIPDLDERVMQMIASHHERYNGTGYPKKLRGAEIPVFAKIAGIVDAYDAMTTPRPYAAPVSTFDAIRQLNNLAGVEFPQEIVEQFVQAIGVFPVGTLVELNTGEVGVVIAQNRVRRLRPKILLLLDKNKSALAHEAIIDLRTQLAEDGGESSLWIERGLTPGDYGIDPSEYYL